MINTGNLPPPLAWRPVSGPWVSLRHWLNAARAWFDKRHQAVDARSTRLYDSLLELDVRTLRDIGAPHALQARALGRRQAQRDRHDDLRASGAGGDWQGW